MATSLSRLLVSNTPGAFRKLDDISASFDGVTLTFPLTKLGVPIEAVTPQNLIVSLSGVIQEPVTSYTVIGTSIVFTEAPVTGAPFFAVLLGVVGTVNPITDGSVTRASLASGAVAPVAVDEASMYFMTQI
jgi:hypothetical protein